MEAGRGAASDVRGWPLIWNRVIGPNGFRRSLDDADLAWVVKATHHEASRNPVEWGAVIWTMLNRWASGRYNPGRLKFGDWIREFSSTVNPEWTVNCRSDETAERCVERQAWVAANIARPYSWYVEHDPQLVAYVQRLFAGRVSGAPYAGLVDFAAPWAGRGAEDVRQRVAGLRDSDVGNYFYREPFSMGWGSGTVRMELVPHGLRQAALGAGLAVLAVGAFLGVRKMAADRGWAHIGPQRSRRKAVWLSRG